MGICPVLALHRDHVAAECAGMRYFFGGADGETLLCVLGFGMLYNHSKSRPRSLNKAEEDAFANVIYSLRVPPEGLRDERDGSVCVRFEAARDIAAGEELLIDYSERWWEAKRERPV